MRITFVVSALHGGGAERVVSELAGALQKSGHEVTVLMCAGDECVYELAQGVRLKSLAGPSGKNPFKILSRLIKMRKYFKEFFADNKAARAISFSTNMNIFTLISTFGIRTGSNGGLSGVFLSERNDPNRFTNKGLRDFVYKMGASRGAGFVFQTEAAADCFPFINRKRRFVVYNPLKSSLPEMVDFQDRNSKVFVAVGRLEKQKNYPLMLRAFREFCKSNAGYSLHIYGQGNLKEELMTLRDALDLGECVIFEGFCQDVISKIKNAGGFLMSSDYEGMPNAMMEAMALGLPVVATDCPIGGPEVLSKGGERALLVPVGDEMAFTSALEKLAKDRNLASSLSREASKIRHDLSMEIIEKEWEKVLS